MAGGQERILRDRIRAVQATKKITRAMELIAGSRIVKAQQRVHAAVPYSEQITEVVHHLAEAGASSDHPILLGRPEVRSICYVIITSDRGLCGGYNSGVLRAAEKEIKADVERGWIHHDGGGRSQGRELPALPRLPDGPGVQRLLREPDLRGCQGHRRAHRRGLRGGSGGPGGARLHPLRLGRQPGGRAAAAHPAGVGARRPGARPRRAATGPRRTTSTSPTRRRSWRRSSPATSRPASTPRCSTPRPPSRRSASGP